MKQNRITDVSQSALAQLESALEQIDIRKTALETLLELIPHAEESEGSDSHHSWRLVEEVQAALTEAG